VITCSWPSAQSDKEADSFGAPGLTCDRRGDSEQLCAQIPPNGSKLRIRRSACGRLAAVAETHQPLPNSRPTFESFDCASARAFAGVRGEPAHVIGVGGDIHSSEHRDFDGPCAGCLSLGLGPVTDGREASRRPGRNAVGGACTPSEHAGLISAGTLHEFVAYSTVSRGSEARRSPSPMRFNARIVMNMTPAGTKLMAG